MDREHGRLRIGELSRRVGVSSELLRAWEAATAYSTRPDPTRSAGGFRLYSDVDAERIGAMKKHVERGLSAAEAARAVLSGTSVDEPSAPDLSQSRASFQEALDPLTRGGLGRRPDHDRPGALRQQTRCGDGCSDSPAGGVAASVRSRCLPVPPVNSTTFPCCCSASPCGKAGWRIAFLGADTPIATIEDVAASVQTSAVVLNAVTPERLRAVERELAGLASRTTVAIGEAGADPELVERLGAVLLQGDPVAAATEFAHGFDF